MPAVLITGANRGLGLEFARQYARDGWLVFAASRDPQRAEQLRGLAKTANGKLNLLEMDVSDANSVRTAASQLKDIAIDVLINNAGIFGEPGQIIGNIDYEKWARVLDVNTLGPMRVTEAFVEIIARSQRRLIVTITSGIASIADNTTGGWIAYRSSKTAVNMVMRSVAVELAQCGIICVVVDPGWVKTDMGGPNAPLFPQTSVAEIRRLIERIDPQDSGKFFRYDGCEHAW